jgi:DNA-binding MarR family transcriptional regulator
MKKNLRLPRGQRRSRTKLDKDGGAARLDVRHLRRLAEFRFRLRLFLHVSQTAAEEMGLRTQQYQLLQCVGGMPEGTAPTIANVAARMLLKHNSAVELVDRSVEQGLLRRSGDDADHRRILLRMTPRGARILASLSEFHTRELEQSGPELVRALGQIVRGVRSSREKAVVR